MEQTFKVVQSENYALRDYVIHLQSRLLDTQGEVPPPPPNVNLTQTSAAPPLPSASEQVASTVGVATPLEAVAQAVAGLAAQEQLARREQQQQQQEQQGEQQQQQQQQNYPSPDYKSEAAT